MQHDPNRPEDVLKMNADDEGENADDYYDCARYGVMEYQETSGGSGYQTGIPYQN